MADKSKKTPLRAIGNKEEAPASKERSAKTGPVPEERKIVRATEQEGVLDEELDLDMPSAPEVSPEPTPEVETDVPETDELPEPPDPEANYEEEVVEEEEEVVEVSKPIPRAKSARPTDFEPQTWASSAKPDTASTPTARLSTGEGAKRAAARVRSGLGKLNILEKACLVLLAIAAVWGMVYFRGLAYSDQPAKASDRALKSLKLPLQGPTVAVDGVRAHWRKRTANDIAKPEHLLLPVVELDFSRGEAFCKVFFRNEKGRIRGDVLFKKVAGGTVEGTKSAAFVGTEGYLNPMDHEWVRAGRQQPWRVQIYESASLYDPIEKAKLLAEFDMPAERLHTPSAK